MRLHSASRRSMQQPAVMRMPDRSTLTAAPAAHQLAAFTGHGYDKGRSKAWQAAWFVTQSLVFGAWWCPMQVRIRLLRLFGAKIGAGVRIRHHVRVLWPWKLQIGDDSWIGEGVWVLNPEP